MHIYIIFKGPITCSIGETLSRQNLIQGWSAKEIYLYIQARIVELDCYVATLSCIRS